MRYLITPPMKILAVFCLMLCFTSAINAYTGRIWITTDAIATDQIEPSYRTDISDTSRLRFMTGYRPGTAAIEAVDESVLARARLRSPIGNEGTVSIWIRTNRNYQTGIDSVEKNLRIFEIENLCSLSFEKNASTLDLLWRWDKLEGNTQYHDLHILAPQLPGSQWLNLVFRWSSSKNIFNCYINGTPYRQDDKISGLSNSMGQNLTVYVSELAFSEMVIHNKMLEGRQLEELLNVERSEQLDKIFGNSRLTKLDIELIEGELLYSNPLREPKDIRGWLPEGDAKISFHSDGLILESFSQSDSLRDGNIVLWCGDDLPPNFIAKWKFQPLSEHGLVMVLFAARGKNGKNIYAPSIAARDGTFSQYVYGDINSYHITYYTNTPYAARNNASLWKNTGFHLASYGPSVVEKGSTDVYEATLIKVAGRIMMAINNWLIIDFTDDGKRFGEVLDWGKIGFRQMRWTRMKYSDFRIYDLKVQRRQNSQSEQPPEEARRQ